MQLAFKFKSIPRDFQVREVPLLPDICDPAEATHTYIWLEKVGYTTFEAQRALQKFFHLTPQQVSAQGLKDEDGVTLQMIAVGRVLDKPLITSFNTHYQSSTNYLKIQDIWGYGQHGFTSGGLHGNTFTITLRSMEKEVAEQISGSYGKNRFFNFVNYYDTQRFGLPCGPCNAHLIGEAILKDDWQMALKEFARTQNMTDELVALLPKSTSKEACYDFFNHVDAKLITFFVSSYNSKIWNEQASQRLQKIPNLKTKALQEENLGELLIPVTTCEELPTVFSIEAFRPEEPGRVISIVKTRLFVVSTLIYCFDPEPDEFFVGKTKLIMSFFLPTGSYATMLLKQLAAQFNRRCIIGR
ncbi:tRNA pseudouridine(13) synthase TruD [Nostoc sp.]|uniref:tRNA pseudouridine(13) synthase TruD n=1 Tax=Nostoc sp. TaxID=1180 RepID=UPI002FF56C21